MVFWLKKNWWNALIAILWGISTSVYLGLIWTSDKSGLLAKAVKSLMIPAASTGLFNAVWKFGLQIIEVVVLVPLVYCLQGLSWCFGKVGSVFREISVWFNERFERREGEAD